MRTIACRTATVARSLRIFQTPGFIVRNHIQTGPSADIGLVNQGSQSHKVTNYTIFRRHH